MKVIKGDIFKQKADAICITTNGYVNVRGECVMGRGIALAASKKFPKLAKALGDKIKLNGNRVFSFIPEDVGEFSAYPIIVTFPVKPKSAKYDGTNAVGHWKSKLKVGDNVMGFACVADIGIIEKSCEQLVEMANFYKWNKVVLPKVGCGAGELEWEDVEYVLNKNLDDRFIICDLV